MESEKISELEQYNGSANGFMVPGVADGETQKADLGAMVDQAAGAAGYLKPSGLKTVNGVSIAGQGDIALEIANPFKGWFKTGDTLPATGGTGDYLYFKDTEASPVVTTIYRWNGTAFENTNTVVDESNVQTFGSGQAVNGVAIKGADGETDSGADGVLSAAAGLQMGAKLEGVTAAEVRQTVTDYKGPSGASSGYFDIGGTWHANSNYKSARFALAAGDKRLRFIGFNNSTFGGNYAYGFLDGDGNPIAGELKSYYSEGIDVTGKCVLEAEVPEGAAYFVCLYVAWSSSSSYQMFREDDFYCYIQSGETVKDMVEQSAAAAGAAVSGSKVAVETVTVASSDYGLFDREFRYIPSGNLSTVRAMATSDYSASQETRYMSLVSVRGGRLRVVGATNSSGYSSHLTFVTRSLAGYTAKTLQQLVDLGLLVKSLHYNAGLWNPVIVLGKGQVLDIEVPQEAFAMFITRAHPDESGVYPMPSSVVATRKEREPGLQDGMEVSLPMGLKSGRFDAFGAVDPMGRGYVTGYIPCGGFVFELHEGYRIAEVCLYDKSLRLVNRYDRREDQDWLRELGFAGCLPQYYMRYRIVKVLGNGTEDVSADYSETGGVVQLYMPLGDGRLHTTLPEGVTAGMFRVFRERVRACVNPVWESVRTMPNPVLQFIGGNVNRGIPYSECGEYGKFVGLHVAYKTFLTAMKNPRSVLYTELVAGARTLSSYGYSGKYHGTGDSEDYYGWMGLVCTGLTAYVSGVNQVVAAGAMSQLMGNYGFAVVATVSKAEGSPAVWKIGSQTVTPEEFYQSLQPMDLVLKSGHCSVISEVMTDDEGVTEAVVWTESVKPRSTSSAYSERGFVARLEKDLGGSSLTGNIKWQIWRQADPTKVALTEKVLFPEVDGDVPFINTLLMSYEPERVSIDKDITTYAGEYAVMTINGDGDDGMDNYNIYGGYLNCHRGGSLYDSLVIEKEVSGSYDVVTVVSIAENGGAVAQSAILAEDAVGEKDWVVVDVNAALGESLSAGKYRAKLTGPDSAESGYTHWLMVEIGLQYSDGVASFNVTGGVPYMVRREDVKGATSYKYEDIAPGETSKAIGRSGYGNNDFVKLFVRTDYGVGVKRVYVGSN